MATPFSRAPTEGIERQAALSGIRDRAAGSQQRPQPAGPAPGQAPPAGGNQVAALLTQVFDLIVNSQSPEELQANLSNLQQFLTALQQATQGVPGVGAGAGGGQQPAGPAPGQPLPV